jgi:L-threonylcarbamoyladenylate synthase
MGDRVEIILDGGPTQVGIESTVIALCDRRPAELLRPGMITREQMEAIIGPIAISTDGAHRSPGQHARHYQPRTPLFITTQPPNEGRGIFLSRAEMPREPEAYAALLYATLHDLDARNLDWIAIEPVPETSEWDGLRDRLDRARTK